MTTSFQQPTGLTASVEALAALPGGTWLYQNLGHI